MIYIFILFTFAYVSTCSTFNLQVSFILKANSFYKPFGHKRLGLFPIPYPKMDNLLKITLPSMTVNYLLQSSLANPRRSLSNLPSSL